MSPEGGRDRYREQPAHGAQAQMLAHFNERLALEEGP